MEWLCLAFFTPEYACERGVFQKMSTINFNVKHLNKIRVYYCLKCAHSITNSQSQTIEALKANLIHDLNMITILFLKLKSYSL